MDAPPLRHGHEDGSVHLFARHPYLTGGAIGLASLPVHALLPVAASVDLAAVLLAVIAGAYIGFAVRVGRSATIGFEMAGAVTFALAALAGLWWSPWAIPAVYVLHGAWDLMHRHHRLRAVVPRWYVPFCIVVDVLAGGGLAAIWLAKGA
ncbi:MAG: DUF6010 family protein [Azospirillaceae bacterium]